jgi:hypothetical protein
MSPQSNLSKPVKRNCLIRVLESSDDCHEMLGDSEHLKVAERTDLEFLTHF